MPDAPVIEILPFRSGAPQTCLIPPVLPARETELYEKIRHIHCDRKADAHKCAGVVILDSRGMTLQCRLCGDHRSVHAQEQPA